MGLDWLSKTSLGEFQLLSPGASLFFPWLRLCPALIPVSALLSSLWESFLNTLSVSF